MAQVNEPPSERRKAYSKKQTAPEGMEPTPAGKLNDMVAGAVQKAAARGVEPVSAGFLTCAAVGFVLACFGPLDGRIALVGVVGPILATVIYPVWGWMAGLHKVPSVRERFADNCYYLGFIFTQIALVIGFMPVALWGEEIGSQDVLRFFGSALGASLVGLVARTFFVQTGHSISENADIIEQEVDLLARSISRQAKGVLAEFQSIAATLGETSRHLNGELETRAQAIAGVTADYEFSLRRDMGRLAEGAEAIGKAAKTAEERAQNDENELAVALRKASEAVERLTRQLHEEVVGAAGAIRSTADSLGAGASALQGLAGIADKLDGVTSSIGGIATRADQLDGTLRKAEQAVSMASDRSILVSQGLAAQTQSVVEGLQSSAADHSERLKTQLNEAVTALQNTLVSFRAELSRING